MNPLTTHDQILAIVDSIPPGRVMTYGSIAEHVSGTGARSVGQTLKTDGHDAPWWRVVNADGRPTPGSQRPTPRSPPERQPHGASRRLPRRCALHSGRREVSTIAPSRAQPLRRADARRVVRGGNPA